MKKISLTLITIVSVFQLTYGQWTTSGSDIYNTNTGNVGIGIAPSQKLHINGNIRQEAGNEHRFYNIAVNNWSSIDCPLLAGDAHPDFRVRTATGVFYMNRSGNVGIGTTSPTAQLTVQKDLAATQTLYVNRQPNASLELVSTTSGAQVTIQSQPTSLSMLSFNHGTTNYGNIYTNSNNSSLNINGVQGGPVTFSANNSEAMRILSSGNVLIGKTSQANSAYLLDIAGNIRSNQVVVNTSGADFVFAPSYRLNSLSDLKKYIDQNHHLPEIASAAQMQKDGLNVGDIQTKLLQKIEELTLYLIEKDKEITVQQVLNKKQREINQSLQQELNDLKKQVSSLIIPKK